jgi:shikimate dehydrogenase
MIQASSRFCAVYGHPIRHSASPAMHNAALSELHLDWRYLAFDVHPDHLPKALDGARAMRFVGLNLTVPHKLLALKLVDVLDDTAQKWGAVNTVRFEGLNASGEWAALWRFENEEPSAFRSVGYNTDADAIVQAMKEDLGFRVKGNSILLLGAGGAGRVAALRFAAEGARELFLVNRTISKIEELRAEIHDLYPATKVTMGYPATEIDVVVNATSLGLRADDPLPWNEQEFDFRKAKSAYDMIYRPAVTPFLKRAREAGLRTANGVGMLLYQGAKALEIWSEKTAPMTVMREALERQIYG